LTNSNKGFNDLWPDEYLTFHVASGKRYRPGGTPNGVWLDVSQPPRETIMTLCHASTKPSSNSRCSTFTTVRIYPDFDESLEVDQVWPGTGKVERQEIPPIPGPIASLMRHVSSNGKLVE
jgi:hypothetical protein